MRSLTTATIDKRTDVKPVRNGNHRLQCREYRVIGIEIVCVSYPCRESSILGYNINRRRETRAISDRSRQGKRFRQRLKNSILNYFTTLLGQWIAIIASVRHDNSCRYTHTALYFALRGCRTAVYNSQHTII